MYSNKMLFILIVVECRSVPCQTSSRCRATLIHFEANRLTVHLTRFAGIGQCAITIHRWSECALVSDIVRDLYT